MTWEATPPPKAGETVHYVPYGVLPDQGCMEAFVWEAGQWQTVSSGRLARSYSRSEGHAIREGVEQWYYRNAVRLQLPVSQFGTAPICGVSYLPCKNDGGAQVGHTWHRADEHEHGVHNG